jgi:hypothetical protein
MWTIGYEIKLDDKVNGKYMDDNKTYRDNDSSDYHMIGADMN